MSALATIASASADDISWKANALLARDTAVKLAGAASGRGRQSFNEAATAKEELFAILNNNTPPGLPEPDPAASLEETADRAAIMTRMQASFDRLKTFAVNEAELTKNAATAAQDARVLAALAKFTSHKDYSGAANADYQEFAKVLVEGGVEMAKAADAKDAATITTVLDRIGTACNNCHVKYRLNSN
jgi:cytochrome c556